MSEPEWNEHWESWLIRETDAHEIFVMPMLFTFAIITVPRGQYMYYQDRWCYMSLQAALAAAQEWDGVNGEPTGWHRHPDSGRRRENGNPATEYVRF